MSLWGEKKIRPTHASGLVVRALGRQEVFYRAIVTHDLDSSIRCPSSEIQKVCLAFRIRLDAVNHEPYGQESRVGTMSAYLLQIAVSQRFAPSSKLRDSSKSGLCRRMFNYRPGRHKCTVMLES